jgi:hypothetical protein
MDDLIKKFKIQALLEKKRLLQRKFEFSKKEVEEQKLDENRQKKHIDFNAYTRAKGMFDDYVRLKEIKIKEVSEYKDVISYLEKNNMVNHNECINITYTYLNNKIQQYIKDYWITEKEFNTLQIDKEYRGYKDKYNTYIAYENIVKKNENVANDFNTYLLIVNELKNLE